MIGDDGSTATTATVRPAARSSAISAATSVDLPAPGGPVIPTRWAAPAERIQAAQRVLGDGGVVLDGGQQPREGAPVAGRGRPRRGPRRARPGPAVTRSARAWRWPG